MIASNTWVVPSVRGDAPEPREGHSAALIGKRLFIFGGCGKYENSEVYYDDLYILNTGTNILLCLAKSNFSLGLVYFWLFLILFLSLLKLAVSIVYCLLVPTNVPVIEILHHKN